MSRVVLQPRWYTVRQAAEELGFSVSKVKMLVKSGKLTSVKDGGNRRILPEWIDDYIAARVREAKAGVVA